MIRAEPFCSALTSCFQTFVIWQYEIERPYSEQFSSRTPNTNSKLAAEHTFLLPQFLYREQASGTYAAIRYGSRRTLHAATRPRTKQPYTTTGGGNGPFCVPS